MEEGRIEERQIERARRFQSQSRLTGSERLTSWRAAFDGLASRQAGWQEFQCCHCSVPACWIPPARIPQSIETKPRHWSIWDFVALGSGTQSHQVLVFPGRPVATTSGTHSGGDDEWGRQQQAASSSCCCARRRSFALCRKDKSFASKSPSFLITRRQWPARHPLQSLS
jgi:hypothetical protein